MARNGNDMGEAIFDAIIAAMTPAERARYDALSGPEQDEMKTKWRVIATAIIAYDNANIEVSTTVHVDPVSGDGTGTGTIT